MNLTMKHCMDAQFYGNIDEQVQAQRIFFIRVHFLYEKLTTISYVNPNTPFNTCINLGLANVPPTQLILVLV